MLFAQIELHKNDRKPDKYKQEYE